MTRSTNCGLRAAGWRCGSSRPRARVRDTGVRSSCSSLTRAPLPRSPRGPARRRREPGRRNPRRPDRVRPGRTHRGCRGCWISVVTYLTMSLHLVVAQVAGEARHVARDRCGWPRRPGTPGRGAATARRCRTPARRRHPRSCGRPRSSARRAPRRRRRWRPEVDVGMPGSPARGSRPTPRSPAPGGGRVAATRRFASMERGSAAGMRPDSTQKSMVAGPRPTRSG